MAKVKYDWYRVKEVDGNEYGYGLLANPNPRFQGSIDVFVAPDSDSMVGYIQPKGKGFEVS